MVGLTYGKTPCYIPSAAIDYPLELRFSCEVAGIRNPSSYFSDSGARPVGFAGVRTYLARISSNHTLPGP